MEENLAINAIKFLGVDMINKAKSGHPGIVLGAAPIAYTLFTRHINIDPKNPNWKNRDRFILSAGHGSALLYALLHLIGVLSKDDLMNFRQLGSLTPGHPEYGHTPCIDMTTGPLGQGISSGVGMAIAEEYLGSYFNDEKHQLFDHYTYVLCGDGDLQEGVCQEAMSLAGHLGLKKLIVLYDSNGIQLDGDVKMACSENNKMKYEAMGFSYQFVSDGANVDEIDKAISKAKTSDKPSLIEVNTVIGAGSKNEGTCTVHGSPIGVDDANELRKLLDWSCSPFEIPSEIYEFFRNTVEKRGQEKKKLWDMMVDDYLSSSSKKESLLMYLEDKREDFDYDKFQIGFVDATRNVAAKIMETIQDKSPLIIGGAADLTRSAMVKGNDGNFSKEKRLGRNICYGVREHAMGAIANGIALSGLKTFTAGFFVFSDYMKPAMRLSSLMGLPVMFFFSHDSIAVGEDGPTHQPIEQLSCLRTIPNMNVMRPCDANETLFAIKWAYKAQNTPSTIVLTRQKVTTLDGTSQEGFNNGAYIISKEKGPLDGILLAAGSEVSLAIEAQKCLEEEEIYTRVVSMPSMYLFDQMSKEYQNEILPKNVKTLAIEMGSSAMWYKYANEVMGIDSFGISAPMNVTLNQFGFNKEGVVARYKNIK